MNELDREMVLAERAEKRDEQRQRRALLRGQKAADKVGGCAAELLRAVQLFMLLLIVSHSGDKLPSQL